MKAIKIRPCSSASNFALPIGRPNPRDYVVKSASLILTDIGLALTEPKSSARRAAPSCSPLGACAAACCSSAAPSSRSRSRRLADIGACRPSTCSCQRMSHSCRQESPCGRHLVCRRGRRQRRRACDRRCDPRSPLLADGLSDAPAHRHWRAGRRRDVNTQGLPEQARPGRCRWHAPFNGLQKETACSA